MMKALNIIGLILLVVVVAGLVMQHRKLKKQEEKVKKMEEEQQKAGEGLAELLKLMKEGANGLTPQTKG